VKLKCFCTTKKMVSQLKMLPLEWEKIFSSYTSKEGQITTMYREFNKNSPKCSDPKKKWTKELNRGFQKKKLKCLKNNGRNDQYP
jgi:hypothetical protein